MTPHFHHDSVVFISSGNNKLLKLGYHVMSLAEENTTLRGQRPHVTMKFSHRSSVDALVDTGAVTSIMSPRAFAQARDAGCVRESVDVSSLTLVSANNSPLDITGAFRVQFTLGDVPITGTFVVVNKLTSHVIIGMNIILKEKMTLKPGSTEVLVRGRQVSFNPPDTSNKDVGWVEAEICATKEYLVNAFEVVKVKCRLRAASDPDRKVGPGTPFVGQINGLPVYAITSERGECDLYLANPHHEPMQVDRNQAVRGRPGGGPLGQAGPHPRPRRRSVRHQVRPQGR